MKPNISADKEEQVVNGKQYLTAFMNNSATIRDELAADITGAPHKAVAYNADGKLTLPAAAGEPVIGIILSDAPANDSGVTPAGTEVDVLIKDIGLMETGAAVAKGDLLTVTKGGTARKTAAGEYIFGIAMTAASAAGELCQVRITQSGYAKAASGNAGGGETPPAGDN